MFCYSSSFISSLNSLDSYFLPQSLSVAFSIKEFTFPSYLSITLYLHQIQKILMTFLLSWILPQKIGTEVHCLLISIFFGKIFSMTIIQLKLPLNHLIFPNFFDFTPSNISISTRIPFLLRFIIDTWH